MADTLVTGFPSLFARRLVRGLIRGGDHVRLLTRHRHKDSAARFLKDCAGEGSAEVLVGDVVLMDLGLSGPEVRRLIHEVEQVYHTASVTTRSHRPKEAEAVNVDGTRSVIELALSMDRLARFNFLSTAFVSGDRRGVVMEEELDRNQRFRTEFERTKFKAEKIVCRAAADIPTSIYRPSLIVGDSQTGEFDHKDDPYHMMVAFLNVPFDFPIPLPGRGDYPLNLVPLDYVVDAMMLISRDPRGAGLTFHLTDPNPLPARRVLEVVADTANRARPRGAIPASLARRLLRLPGFGRLGPPLSVVDHFNQLVIYNNMNTLEILNGTELRCPPFETYVGNLVAHLKNLGRPSSEGDPDATQTG